MKELTIKKETLDVVRQMVADGQVSQEVAEKYFPEFRESESERIRKALKEYFINSFQNNGVAAICGVHIIDILTWLEKQGENISLPKFTFDDVLALQCAMEAAKKVQKDKDLYEQLKSLHDRLHDAYWLEKQGEQKPNPYSGTSFEYNGHTWGMCARDNGVEIIFDGELKAFLSLEKSFIYPIHPQSYLTPKSAMEAIKEEKVDNQNCVKPANKVEPKFKVGDWIINNEHNNVAKVLEINNEQYRLDYFDTVGTISIALIDNDYHLWTIQDAMDGDVLAFKNDIGGIIICKSPTDYDTRSYCRLVNDNFINKEESGWDSTLLVPATKEQCDLLFQKMHEAGYEWDAEKKELKKIDARENLTLDGDLMEADCMIVEQKSSWSEEDKNFMYDTLSNLTELKDRYGEGYGNVGKCIDWLKSLKTRYTWKPSDEQIEILDMVLTNESMDDNIARILRELREQLKKLKGE